MRNDRPYPLAMYRRDFTPDFEVAPREPVFAKSLVSPKGVPFVLVQEAIGHDDISRMLAWLIWRDRNCVGYVGTTLSGPKKPFEDGPPLASRRQLNVRRAVTIWRCHIADGSGRGTGAEMLARVPSRGLGIMTAAYAEIVRQLSEHGWALASKPENRSREAKWLWRNLRSVPGIEVVRSRSWDAKGREFAFILEPNLGQ